MLRNGKWQIMTELINYDSVVSGIGLDEKRGQNCDTDFKTVTFFLVYRYFIIILEKQGGRT